MESLVIVAVVVVLAGPVLGIMALVAVRRLEGESQTGLVALLTSRIFALEQKIAELQQPQPRTPEAPSAESLADQIRVSAPVGPEQKVTAPPPTPLPPPIIAAARGGPTVGISDPEGIASGSGRYDAAVV